jgi:DNA-directed RNA polymerase specialized sigma24 family protein
VLDLDAALVQLEGFDPRLAEIVKLRCFVGLTIAEAACALGVSTRTVDRDWTVARAWLKARLGNVAADDRSTHGGDQERPR